ncbi:MAG: YeiH family protein [Blastocatellales bacterium]
MLARIIFLLCFIFVCSPYASPPLALAIGLGFGLLFTHPYSQQTKKYSKTLLQVCVVGLGFGMNLQDVIRAGLSGFVYTAIGIAGTMLAGIALGRLLKVESTSALLISVGTAICGGSAIAAVGPVAGAKDEEMSVSLGTVFILNSVALLVFPMIGAAYGLSGPQFGLWSALAIHDTSSVVGAAAKYGMGALAVGTTVKLARALWIVPLTLATAAVRKREASIQWPWFILFFCLAAVVNTYLPSEIYPVLTRLARTGLTLTLFLIGSGISKATLRRVGVRPLVLGVVLWLLVGTLSLLLIRYGVIAL